MGAAVAEFYSKLCAGCQFGTAQPLMAFILLDILPNHSVICDSCCTQLKWLQNMQQQLCIVNGGLLACI